MAEPKKKLGLLIGLGPKPEGEEEGPSEDSPKTMAARGVYDALKNDDFPAFEDALTTFVDSLSAPSLDD